MTIQLIIDNLEIPVKHIRFSDGGSNVKLEVPEGFKVWNYISVTVDPITPCDNVLWEVKLVLDALSKFPFDKLKTILNLPYLPHGRADRRFEVGNAFPLNVFLLHLVLDFDEIHLTDPHSDWSKGHLPEDSVYTKYQHQCFAETVRDIESCDFIISPDKGAKEKIRKLQQHLAHYKNVVTFVVEAEKERDVETGKINPFKTNLPKDVDFTDKVCYIVDDICDGGGTFIPLAEKLKEAGAKEVHLYVTHGIFAKGLALFKGKIDKLHVYQTVSNYVTMTDIMNFNEGKEVK